MKRLLILLLAIGTLPIKLTSCGWDWSAEEYRFWLLQPHLIEAQALKPFAFTTEMLFEPDYEEITRLPYAANIAEWHSVIGDDVPDDAIEQVLYGMDLSYFEQHIDSLKRSNAFLRRLERLNNGWPAYIAFAKRCEQLVNSEDPWDFIAHDGNGIRKAWESGTKELKRAKHPMLRARYAFQLVRLAHYAHDPERPDLPALPIYEKDLAPLKGRTWMEASAAFYLAGMLENPERDLAFADCFQRATDKRFRMVQLFIGSEAENYLPLATSDEQRAALLIMRDLQHPGRALEDLERIAAWPPGSEHLPLLLAREVNKLEDWLLTPDLTEYGPAIQQWESAEDEVTPDEVVRVDMDYLHRVQAFIRQVIPTVVADDKPLLLLLDGHLSYVAGEHERCMTIMAAVEADGNAPPKVRAQARLDRILCGIMASSKLTDATRNDLLALVQLVNEEPALAQVSGTLLGQLHLYLGKKLMERGETVEGILLLARTDRSYGDLMPLWYGLNARHMAFLKATPAQYDQLIALLDKRNKTPFERYLTGTDERPAQWHATENTFHSNDLTRDKLLDYKAMWYLRENRLEEAAKTYRQVAPDYWQRSEISLFADDDPFVVNIYDPHNYLKTDSARYTRLSIVERMLALKKEAARDSRKAALNCFLLGNTYYSMSWHGKYWGLSRIGWSVNELNGYDTPTWELSDDANYYGTERAREHYLLAMETTSDPVLKALACLMANQCAANKALYESSNGNYQELAGPYLEDLTDDESQEAYRALEDCAGYACYVKRFR